MKHLLEDTPAEVAQWTLTYGDLMSLLLTFFVMLLSMSEIKQSDKYQGVANSLNGRFGSARNIQEFVPGEGRPRDPRLAAPAVAGRNRRDAALNSAPDLSAAAVLANREAAAALPELPSTIPTPNERRY
jgi:chemotaxis protein MotB